MIIESLGLVAHRNSRKELEATLSFLMNPLRAEAGCVTCHLFQDTVDPNSFRFECIWDSEADLIRHLRSEIYRHFLFLMELCVEQPIVQFHSVADTRGLELVHATRLQNPERVEDIAANFENEKPIPTSESEQQCCGNPKVTRGANP